ncbi:flagellar basal body L-ring protein FlgH [Teredinibacter sp. KSP-S5-2]|uniref:flagellar basal body L-ring protein FlgH n=1 Tax=Teredinibacter sp. KSP-S5-2 TaxID=3034506 RepID=UPI002934379A|nr:flagellar basal body L-ring protein FlgH [Teredinibacter sp. KSP-S5-2]WNO07967.1 flagellar basal body L-ring protein FlgH [Teredinibacter sp. KSP-S5-2]
MNSVIRFFSIIIASSAVLLMQGCVINQPAMPDDPYYAPVLSTSQYANQPVNGSLYSNNTSVDLFSDVKAKRVGDIITIVLNERTTSSKQNNIDLKKENTIGIESNDSGAGTVFGIQPTIGNLGLGANLTGNREFKGEAGADQSNKLQGNISVTVVEVFPNGTLSVRGEKWITLNRGDEFIRISGLVRPEDVSPSNTVSSMKIANARITYAGRGELAESQEMGWLSRFFNSSLWPF